MARRSENDPASELEALREPVRRFTLRILRDPEAAEDVTSEAILVVLDRVRRGERLENPRAYAFQVAWLKTRGALRRKRPAAWSEAAEKRFTYDPRRYRELREWVMAAFDRLDEETRALLTLRHEAHLGHREIAEVLECPLGSVGDRLARAEAALERGLRRVGRGEELPFAVALLPAALALEPVPAAVPAAAAAISPSFSLAGLLWSLAMKKSWIVTLAVLSLGGLGWWMTSTAASSLDETHQADRPERTSVIPEDPREASEEPSGGESSALASTPYVAPQKDDALQRTQALQRTTVTITGRVVDEDRRPVPDAAVTILSAGETLRGLVTDEGGGFYASLSRRRRGIGDQVSIHALHPEAGAAVRGRVLTYRNGSRFDLGTLTLRPPSRVDVRVTREGLPRTAAVRVLLRPELSGAHNTAYLGTLTTDARGLVSLPPLPPGRLELRAHDDDGHQGRSRTTLLGGDRREEEIALSPGASVTLTIEDSRSGLPIPRARVVAHLHRELSNRHIVSQLRLAAPRDLALTDSAGKVTIHGLVPGVKLFVNAFSDRHFLDPTHGKQMTIRAGAQSAKLSLPPSRTMRFPLAKTDPSPPEEGTTIEIHGTNTFIGGLRPPERGRIEGDALVVPAWSATFSGGLAVAPDGRVAPLMALHDRDVGRPIRFGRASTATILVRDDLGAPLSDVTVELRQDSHDVTIRSAQTDDEGLAVLGPLGSGRGEVFVRMAESDGRESVIPGGQPDWTQPEPRLEVTVPRPVPLVLRFVCEGRPRIPPDLRVRVSGQTPTSWREDPSLGIVAGAIRFAPGVETVHAWIASRGWSRTARLLRPSAGESLEHVITWRETPSLEFRVAMPKDGEMDLALMTQPKDGGPWSFEDGYRPLGWQPGEDGFRRGHFACLPPGNYRLHDRISGLMSRAAPVQESAAAPEITFDLEQARWTEGRVVAPEETDLKRASVIVEPVTRETAPIGAGESLAGRGLPLDDTGRFRLRITGRHPMRLTASHPALQPHPERGAVTGSEFPSGLVLELHRKQMLQFVLEHPASIRRSSAAVQVHAYAPGDRTKPAWSARARLEPKKTQRVELGSVKPGTWDLVVDVPGCAVLELPTRRLGKELVDLGTLRPEAGITLAFELDDSLREGLQTMQATATSLGDRSPALRRSSTARNISWLRVRGLTPGRWRVQVYLQRQGRHQTWAEEVDVPSTEQHVVRITSAR